MKITKETLKKKPDREGEFINEFVWKGRKIELSLDPDDTSLDETLALANKVIGDFEVYYKKAEDAIVRDFLDTYNDTRGDSENGHPELSETEHRRNPVLDGISCLSKNVVDFTLKQYGKFGSHLLVAQSFG